MNPYLSKIGYQGPNTLLALILLSLAYQKRITEPRIYILVIFWQFVSHLINVVIKNTLKHPRPDTNDTDNKAEEFAKLMKSITWNNYLVIHRNFGMPSGHAQAVISELTFITLFFKNPLLTAVAAAQAALTLYQRYNKRRHSIPQLMAGSALGIVIGFVFYGYIKNV